MPLFGRRRDGEAAANSAQARPALATSAGMPEPTQDWTDPQTIRAEWEGQVQGNDDGMLGWRNGTRMFEEGLVPAQTLNVAEYLTRGLSYHLFDPILTDQQAKVAAQRVLGLIDQVPSEPAFLAQFAPRISRLALTVAREKRWQPASLGGDGSITTEILGAS